MSEATLLLARHGQATHGPDHIWTPQDPLTEIGQGQARDLARHIATLADQPVRIVASPFTRAQQTAAPVSDLLGLPIETDNRLAEFGNSTPAPFTITEMIEKRYFDKIWAPEDENWDGESLDTFWRRVEACADDLAARGGVTLVVSHGGTTAGFVRWAFGVPHDQPDRIDIRIANASVTEIRLREDDRGRERRFLRRLSDASYLTETTLL